MTLKRVENRDFDIEIPELEHLETELSKDRTVLAGYMVAGGRLRAQDLSGIIALLSSSKARMDDCKRRI